jgi:hypothetical protein
MHDQQDNVNSFGKLWHGTFARRAKSVENIDGGDLRICFRNLTDERFLLCWIDKRGKKYHYYILDPYTGPMEDSSTISGINVSTNNCEVWMSEEDGDHIESTQCGHAFIIAQHDDVDGASQRQSLRGATPIGAYSAKQVRPRNFWNNVDDEHIFHLVTVNDKHQEVGTPSSTSAVLPDLTKPLRRLRDCCRPTQRKRRHLSSNSNDEEDEYSNDLSSASTDHDNGIRYYLKARAVTCDRTPFDTTAKVYEKTTLGKCQWPANVETNLFQDDTNNIKQILETDLDCAYRYLPEHCRDVLKSGKFSTPLWINKTIKYGPKACPTTGHGMCFHPSSDYLVENGLSKDKCGGVELYELESYIDDRTLWGTGGSFLHEFAHAYHRKCLKGGFDNRDVLNCYKQAMKDRLYINVKVHGTEGPTAKAYACTDQMEYFAELSAAFLGGIQQKEDETEDEKQDYPISEFNKWYPFNRQQIREHDPRAYEMLKRAWKVEEN